MLLIDKIKLDKKEAMLESYKSKDENGKKLADIKKNLLATLIGDCCKDKKEPEDLVVTNVIQQFIKKAKENLEICKKSSHITLVSPLQFEVEIDILTAYLPKQLTVQELTKIIENFINTTPLVNKGQIMKHLSSEYKNQFEGKVANEIITNLLK